MDENGNVNEEHIDGLKPLFMEDEQLSIFLSFGLLYRANCESTHTINKWIDFIKEKKPEWNRFHVQFASKPTDVI